MTDEERYSKYYKGRAFRVPLQDIKILYHLGYFDNNEIKLIWHTYDSTKMNSTRYNVINFLNHVDSGDWVMDIKHDRELKLKRLLKK